MAAAAAAAAAGDEPRVRGCHIVAVPFPGRGHVNAMMNLSRLLAARGAAVTFVVTEEWLGLIRSSSSSTAVGVRLRAIPNVIPSEHGRAADHSGFLDAVATEMEAPFERLLDGLEGPPPAALVADAYASWVVGVGNRRGVPVWPLFPMAASFFFAYYHYDRLPTWLTGDGKHAPDSGEAVGIRQDRRTLASCQSARGVAGRPSSSEGGRTRSLAPSVAPCAEPRVATDPVQVKTHEVFQIVCTAVAWKRAHVNESDGQVGSHTNNSDQRLMHYISSQASSSIRLSDLEPLIHNKRTVKHILSAISSTRNAQCLLFTTMYELEASVIDSLRSVLSCPVYPIGPCVPYMTLGDHSTMSNGDTSQGDYFTWLNSQPVSSVLYVSLGSFVSVSTSQLDEIALGLAASEVRFLWILREQSPRVRDLIGDTDKGMILPWCEQLKVLCHSSVGGFLTHCGMNSTLEAVFAGVPMLALPLFFDQPLDGRLIAEEWKIGLNLRDWANKDGLIGREDIARAAKRLMSSDEAEAKAVRRRALEWKEASRRALDKGGSSYGNLSSLMEMVCASE